MKDSHIVLRSFTLSVGVFLFFACFVGIAVSAGESRPKNVRVSLRARWPGTPLLLEAGELLAREWKGLYWDFIDVWLKDEGDSGGSTARSCFKKIVEHGRSLLSEQLGSIFEFTLLLRATSPRLVLYQQLAQESLASPSAVDGSVLKSFSGNATKQVSHGPNVQKPEGGTTLNNPAGSCCWIDTGGKLLFNESQFLSWIDGLAELSRVSSMDWPELFDFDHVYHGTGVKGHAAILYGALGTKCFRDFHHLLVEAAEKGTIKYIVRPVLLLGCEAVSSHCSSVGSLDTVNLGGYGVELALKNMEYKAMDDSAVKKGVTLEDPHTEDLSQDVRGFIFSKLLDRKPELTSEIMAFRDHLLSSTVSDTLEVWELKDLGHQTAQRIVHASDPLQAMQEINQNFPGIVSSLSRMKLDDSIKDEIVANQRMVSPGKSLVALNGALLNIEDIDLYFLMDLVHEELSLADQFSALKLPQSTIRKLLAAPPSSESHVIRVDFRSSPVHYLNDLEKDALYKRWRRNINEILMPVFPGQLHYIRKNMFHAVYVIDPGTPCGAKSIDMILSMYENSVPMRFGVILYSLKLIKGIEGNGGELPITSENKQVNENTEDASSLVIQLFLYIKENYGAQMSFQFLTNLNRLSGISEDLTEVLEVHHVEEAFVKTLVSKAKILPQEILLQLQKDLRFKDEAGKSTLSVFKLGLSSLHCCLLMNGLVNDATEDASMEAMNVELPRIQEQVYYGQIDSNTDILETFLSGGSYKRYNPQIIGEGKGKKKFVSLSPLVIDKESVLGDITYLYSQGAGDELKPVTHLLLVDVTSRKGLSLVCEGIQYLIKGTKRARLGVLFSLDSDVVSPALLFANVFNITASSFSDKGKVLDFLDQLCSFYGGNFVHMSALDGENYMLFTEKIFELAETNGLPSEFYRKTLSNFTVDQIKSHLDKVSHFLYGQLGLGLGANAVITNGRVILPKDDNIFSRDDFDLLESIEFVQRSKGILEIIDDIEWIGADPDDLTSEFISDVVLSVSSSLSIRKRSSERAHFEILNAEHSAVVLNNKNATIHIDAVVDPLSPSGQKLSPLLHILWKHIKPSMRIVLNPMSSLVDLPLKNYYRYVSPTMDDFSGTDYSVTGPKAFFSHMPQSKTLTMNLDVPEAWLVEPIVAIHDLDNILLENLGEERTLQAVFELEALVLTGHCSEKDHDPPRGLQLILGTKNMPHLVDTLVMANLGYWQMKVTPGGWYLQLAPGRSSDIYELKDVDGSQQNPSAKHIIIDDLRGKPVQLEAVKREGKEHEELLTTSGDDKHLPYEKKESCTAWNANLLRWASGIIGGIGTPRNKQMASFDIKSVRHGKTINIFSIASGHLYERFLKIMMLSVLGNTNRPVKFWFIKNYLSPQFKDVIPHMAGEYGFEYELITYKWPAWLHKQKEKQRIIWAYKILFLDVVFPLSLERVIFVDADQVVRTDMGELYDMDIKGRPLAYTPFCDNNKEMDGYRFWRQGFWKDHLRGKPYHISALYVVDLVKFRQTAAGDNLRVFYETLSKDPNSLSNLDQDLPNYAQHTVPIFSLPQEWLWCESWCGNATKSKAKTIDLCNNPMTKEPKLQGARRIVPEWVDLDAEARQFTERILGEGVVTQEAVMPSPPRVPPSCTPPQENSPAINDDAEYYDKYRLEL